jgi:four helix bundle protein
VGLKLARICFFDFFVFTFAAIFLDTIYMKATGNIILDKSFAFALAVVEFTDMLESKRKYAIANQLTKSGTSIAANIREAQAPESKADFVHKMKIAAKEANETEFWLLLCKHAQCLPDPGQLPSQLAEIQKILSAIISTSKKRL